LTKLRRTKMCQMFGPTSTRLHDAIPSRLTHGFLAVTVTSAVFSFYSPLLGPFYGAIAVPSVTRCRCCRRCCCCCCCCGHLHYGYSWLRLILVVVTTVATPGLFSLLSLICG